MLKNVHTSSLMGVTRKIKFANRRTAAAAKLSVELLFSENKLNVLSFKEITEMKSK